MISLSLVSLLVAFASIVLAVPFHVDHEKENNDRYLVLFKPDTDMRDILHHWEMFRSVYRRVFSFEEDGKLVRGYSSIFSPSTFSSLVYDKSIDYVEKDLPVSILGATTFNTKIKKQEDAPWGISRTSHRNLTEDHTYYYESKDGKGVDVYVIDTGVYVKHSEFQGRARWGASFLEYSDDLHFVEKDDLAFSETDGNGHGTHCAGTIAGKTFGVCKHCNIVAVQVLSASGSGTLSGVIAGIEWAVNDFLESGRHGVASMSLGASYSKTLNRAIDAAVDKGLHLVVAAGNDNRDSCSYSPASSEKAITVGATSKDDTMSWFSNWGKCVDIFAPGHEILSSWIGGKDAKKSISGTSMATPHVSGTVAALLSRKALWEMDPKQMKTEIQELATKEVLRNIPEYSNTVNYLLFNGINGDEKDLERAIERELFHQQE
jgi:cerevisin